MKLIHAVVVLVALLLLSGASSAALTDWGSGQVTHVIDADDGFLPGREILAAWHKYDAGVHYFRMDLKASPMGPTEISPSFAGVYGIAININEGVGVNGLHPNMSYAPDVVDIEYLLDAHFESMSHLPNNLQLQFAHYHEWEVNRFTFESLAGVGGAFERTGATMEWSIPDAMIGSPGGQPFHWYAYTLDSGSEAKKYDLAMIPEPVTLTALGLGLAGLSGYVRRRLRR